MGNPFTGRTSRTAAGWIFAGIFFGWVAFVIFVDPRPKPEPPPWKPPPPVPRLAAFGLPENPDWEQLPELFHIWQDEAGWVGDRTTFAYWNPTSADYSYVFEATRRNGRITFRLLALPKDYDPALSIGESRPTEHPLRFLTDPDRVSASAQAMPRRRLTAPPGAIPTQITPADEVSPVPVDAPLAPGLVVPAPKLDHLHGRTLTYRTTPSNEVSPVPVKDPVNVPPVNTSPSNDPERK